MSRLTQWCAVALVGTLSVLGGCGAALAQSPPGAEPPADELGSQSELFTRAERGATEQGRQVLSTARKMMLAGDLVVGSCWDYANAVYKRAVPDGRRAKRKTVFKGSRKKRRFANINLIEPGDWLYYINHQYNDVQHSAIFVAWLNKAKKQALMITYRGARRRVPGVLDEYDLSSVYRIIRHALRPE